MHEKQSILIMIALVSLLLYPISTSAEPVKVEVTGTAGNYQLIRDGKPYFIQGGGGNASLDILKDIGGNSIRTWAAENIDKQLDEAQKQGLTVTVGIWLGHPRHGFDYTNTDQVEGQLEAARKAILKYKDHPAVLAWGIGNEVEGMGNEDNAAIWSAINSIALMAHHIDPNHPTMVVVAEIGGKKVRHIHKLCPEIDIVGINSYGGIASIPKRYKEAGGTKPYVITEFGPPGIWESPKDAFGIAIEMSSTDKALRYADAWNKTILGDKGQCLGGYAFVWGQKQEATATWFGTFLPEGQKLAPVDALTEVWHGKPIAHHCPVITSLNLANPAGDLEPGATITAKLDASHPDKDAIKVKWILQEETAIFGGGGDAEAAPATHQDAITASDATQATVKMPASGGAYRLYAYVYDSNNGAAVANIPLHVKGPVVLPKSKTATLPLIVYDEGDRETPAFIPAGWMGNAKAIVIDIKCDKNPHSGKTCTKFDFTQPTGWGGVVWQSPAGDWGDRPGGYDLTGAKKITFFARGEKGGEAINFRFGVIGKEKRFFDTATGKLENVKLTTEWKQYEIDLTGKDLTRIKSGFSWSLSANGEPVTFYLDDIQFE